jgi:hypothetical protein
MNLSAHDEPDISHKCLQFFPGGVISHENTCHASSEHHMTKLKKPADIAEHPAR